MEPALEAAAAAERLREATAGRVAPATVAPAVRQRLVWVGPRAEPGVAAEPAPAARRAERAEQAPVSAG